jgi:hypothetical protein
MTVPGSKLFQPYTEHTVALECSFIFHKSSVYFTSFNSNNFGKWNHMKGTCFHVVTFRGFYSRWMFISTPKTQHTTANQQLSKHTRTIPRLAIGLLHPKSKTRLALAIGRTSAL